RVSASSAPKGSSSSSTSGLRASARAIEARWAMPPETSRGRRSAACSSPTSCSRWRTRSRPARRPVLRGRPRATFWARVRQGSRRGSWKATAMRGSVPVSGVPSRPMVPALGRSRPATRRSRVDLPQPEGPITATISPARSSRSSSRSTSCRPWPAANVRATASRRTACGAAARADGWWLPARRLPGAVAVHVMAGILAAAGTRAQDSRHKPSELRPKARVGAGPRVTRAPPEAARITRGGDHASRTAPRPARTEPRPGDKVRWSQASASRRGMRSRAPRLRGRTRTGEPMSFQGMEVDEVRDLAQRMRESQQRLAAEQETLQGRMAAIPQIWRGGDAEAFRDRWDSQVAPAWRDALDLLQRTARSAEEHAAEQDVASAPAPRARAGGDGAGGMGDIGFTSDEGAGDVPMDQDIQDAWQQMSAEDRRAVLQEMVDQEFERYGMEPVDITFFTEPPEDGMITYGSWTDG